MTGKEIIERVKVLNLPKGSYIIFGSAPMALAGIREASDIDMLVSDELFAKFKAQGWTESVKSPNDKPLVRGVFEVHSSWNFSSYQPTLHSLLATATESDGIFFASIEEVKKWKISSGRPKDLVDIQLIDEYHTSSF